MCVAIFDPKGRVYINIVYTCGSNGNQMTLYFPKNRREYPPPSFPLENFESSASAFVGANSASRDSLPTVTGTLTLRGSHLKRCDATQQEDILALWRFGAVQCGLSADTVRINHGL